MPRIQDRAQDAVTIKTNVIGLVEQQRTVFAVDQPEDRRSSDPIILAAAGCQECEKPSAALTMARSRLHVAHVGERQGCEGAQLLGRFAKTE